MVSGPDLFIGVDGGGTRCRVRVRDRAHRLVGSAEGGAANVGLDLDGALRVIGETILTALRSGGFDASALETANAGLGLAGASAPGVADRLRAALPELKSMAVSHDGVTACLGAHGGRDGGVVIAGTGSAAVLLLDRKVTSLGGRGFLLGDDGSAAWIGRAIWRRALRAHDGLELPSPLLDGLMRRFDNDPGAAVAWGRAAPSHAYAAYAPQVFAAAASGDHAATSVVAGAAAAIGELVEALARRGAPRISLVGGMAEAVTPHLTSSVQDLLHPPLADALEGALALAGLPHPT